MLAEKFMKRALDLAALGKGSTSPNPMVGAVITKNRNIIGEGWHEKAGAAHAEINALEKAGTDSIGSEMYVTLEPCSHYGRTGPCADAIIKAGIKKVFVAMRDPNPEVSGRGIEKLKNAGIDVEEGVLKEEAQKLNEVFFKWIKTKKPFIVSKYAMTLDGKIATVTGDSKWISGDKSRLFTHELRKTYDGILVGIGTVLADDPYLTARIENAKNPIRIIVDSTAKIPISAKVLEDNDTKVVIAVTKFALKEKIKLLEKISNVEVIVTKDINKKVDLNDLLATLGQREITSILVEGGGEIHASLLENNLVDKVHIFIAPKIITGKNAPSPVAGAGIKKIANAITVKNIAYNLFDEDIMITGYL